MLPQGETVTMEDELFFQKKVLVDKPPASSEPYKVLFAYLFAAKEISLHRQWLARESFSTPQSLSKHYASDILSMGSEGE